MASLTLVIGNKRYSSWSLRPWLALRHTGLPFDEILVPLRQPDSKATLLRYSPGGQVPALIHGDLTIWESLAICEYLADLCPEARLWPEDRTARAVARAVACEMHAGYVDLRRTLSMDVKERHPDTPHTPECEANIARILALWQDCRQRFGQGGPFLFGAFSNADAMFAPVCTRFVTYDVPLPVDAQAYVNAMYALPALQDWIAAAGKEEYVFN